LIALPEETYTSLITNNILTITDLNAAIASLEALESGLYKSGKVAEKIEWFLPENLAHSFRECLESNKVDIESPEQVEHFIAQVKKELRATPVISLKLAFSPRRKFVTKLADWWGRQLGSQFVLDVSVDPDILGGVEVMSGGKFHDLTVSRRLKELVTGGKLLASRYL